MTTTYDSYKFPAKAYDANGEHTGPGPWLSLIWAANDYSTGFFGAPVSTGNREDFGGRYVEEYPDARVIHNQEDDGDPTVSIVPTSPFGAEVLAEAVKAVQA